jgi:predicted enzyme related to lactoylglutathione lyase
MPRPVHFEIHAADPARAKAFYEKVFGWTFHKWEGAAWEYWLIGTGPKEEPGIDGGMIKRQGNAPAAGQAVNAFVCTIGVTDLDATLAAALAAGASIALPKAPIPGVGWLAYVHDTEGNILGMTQSDPSAK